MTVVAAPAGVAIPRSEITRALRAAASVKAKTVHIDLNDTRLRVAAHTSDVAVGVELDADTTDSTGSISVSRTLLAGVVVYCGADLSLAISEDEKQLTVVSDESEFTLRASPATATGIGDGLFGHSLDADGAQPVRFEAPVLVETLRRALPFASRDETRPVLTTVALYPDANCAVATDSYRLAVVRYGDDGENGEPILLNVHGATSLQRLLSKKLGAVEITATGSHYLASFEDTRWSLRKPSGTKGNQAAYPNWRALLPSDDPTCTLKVDREELLAGARAASVVASRHQPLKLTIGASSTSVATAGHSDNGSMTRGLSSAEVSGEGLEIGLNPDFLRDICAMAPVERLTVTLIAPLRPICVEAARDTHLLMPIRLNV